MRIQTSSNTTRWRRWFESRKTFILFFNPGRIKTTALISTFLALSFDNVVFLFAHLFTAGYFKLSCCFFISFKFMIIFVRCSFGFLAALLLLDCSSYFTVKQLEKQKSINMNRKRPRSVCYVFFMFYCVTKASNQHSKSGNTQKQRILNWIEAKNQLYAFIVIHM